MRSPHCSRVAFCCYLFAAAIVMIAGEKAMAGWYTDSLKSSPIIDIRGETDDSALARQRGDRYIDDNLDYLLANNEWLIVNFCAYWCGDCNKFKPDFLKASKKKEYRAIRWAHADVDGVRGNENLRERFNLPGTPTVILFHHGHPVLGDDESPHILDGHEGDKGYDDIIAYLNRHYHP
jgi:thiol:disulfide interchange protein